MPLRHGNDKTNECNERQHDEAAQEHGDHTSERHGQRVVSTDTLCQIRPEDGVPIVENSYMTCKELLPPAAYVEDSCMNHYEARPPPEEDSAVYQGGPHFATTQTTNDEVQAMRRVITSLPRPQTFHRQQSEKRDRLLPVPDFQAKRRAESSDTRHSRSCSTKSNTAPTQAHTSVPGPDVASLGLEDEASASVPSTLAVVKDTPQSGNVAVADDVDDTVAQQDQDDVSTGQLDLQATTNNDTLIVDGPADDEIQQQFRDYWVLNLSMHFRDKSKREKFFITYAQTPTLWRRMTISLDYRDAPADSLEAELNELHFQRDKSFRIFDALRESLPEIQFYDTVTNLKLETTPEDGQLHVHVREDANEIIEYPSALLTSQIDCDLFTESQVFYHSHVSGFVYKVVVDGRILIKKEIPGPDTIDEFLYEVNALNALQDCENVIHLEGLITSNDGTEIKGLLIPYCTQGALVDILYDWEAEQLPMSLRLKWARQIIQGLTNIHEAGFVQGDFTLSNVVIDEYDDAHIIDINRRGCPVGWEPPELSTLIEQGQRISMYIGVKTDLYQLGMVLWALARMSDEPERCIRPLEDLDEMPVFYQDVVRTCLSERPQGRQSAASLLRRMDHGMMSMPTSAPKVSQSHSYSDETASMHRSGRQYIDPEAAVTIDDIHSRHGYGCDHDRSPTIPQSRGRSPGYSSRHRSSFFDGATTSATSVSASPVLRERAFGELKEVASYPQEIYSDDLDDKHYDMMTDLPHVPLRYHRIQHEDSGFDEHLADSLVISTGGSTSSHDEKAAGSRRQDARQPR